MPRRKGTVIHKLPRCDEPRLEQFPYDHKIEFRKLLGQDREQGGVIAGHGYVFSVLIDSKPFALKMFKFYDTSDGRDPLTDDENRQVSDEIVEAHCDSFYAECRAYGRIKEKKCKRLLAVPCYGFLHVAAEEEERLYELFQVEDWNRQPDEHRQKPSDRSPFRALVKQLVEDDPPLNPRRMLAELRQLKKIGVHPMDVCMRNYKGGYLVDFSIAWTMPYFMTRFLSQRQLDSRLRRDLIDFDDLVKESGVRTKVRAATEPIIVRASETTGRITSNTDDIPKLRPRK
ncbi:hypothetical protein EV356DRAFT_576299 [Viridothelium virens]|uniref:Protein kinase domain-containing protein n=1 Tax=Viridothelium virens TaxID=1048519 RepID=A0A6A6H9P0_VIRVR|nr:hypothetical protein EV356DRAFT_576299 [Viridothelium virens]